MMVGVYAALLMLASLPAPGPATVEPQPVAAEVAPASPFVEEPAPAAEPAPAPPKRPAPVGRMAAPVPALGKLPAPVRSDRVAGGEHFRLAWKGGIVHVWTPPGFDAASAGTVVYVHGYRSSADDAWREHRLAEQFRASRQNALFVVPDGPQSDPDPVRYDRLSELLREVARRTHLPRPPGHVVAMVHSGGFRSVAAWLEYQPLDHVILLDALYGADERFLSWALSAPGHEPNKLTIVGMDTAPRAEPLLRRTPGAVMLPRIPDDFGELSPRERTARILYMHAQYGHMEMVTSGRVIPVLLRRAPLAVVQMLAQKHQDP
jgi:hypothetical protein